MLTDQAPQTNKNALYAHLRHITRRWHELDEPCLLEIVYLTNEDAAKVKQVAHYNPTDVDQVVSDVLGMNRYQLNAYATVNPVSATNRPQAGKRASKEHIVASFFQWADADSAEAAQNIRSFVGPKPTFTVLTGTQPCARPHVYWELEEPARNFDAWTRTQRDIAATLHTDPQVIDPPRIMRLAGTVNWPKPQKQAKGYVAETTDIYIHDPDARPPVSSAQIARAFASTNQPRSDGMFAINTGGDGKSAEDFTRILTAARTDGEKHGAVRDLTASLAGQGVNKALAEAIVRNACPVWDDNVENLLNTAYEKYYSQSEPAAEPVTPQTIQDFKIDSSEDFLSDLQPLEYLVDGLLPTGVVYSLTGHAGHGKTTLALQFAISVARGEMFADRSTSKGSVLILAGENPYNVKWQYAAALAARELKPSDVDIHFVQGRFSIAQFANVLRAKMEAMPNLKLVIVDSLQAFFEGDNDNDNSQMVEMAHKLRNIGDTANKPAMLIIAHPAGKTPSKDNLVPRGGGAFLNEIDGNLTVWSPDAGAQTLHHSQKFRGAGFDPLEWVMQVHEFSHLTDIHGTPLKLPVSRPETTIERANRELKADEILQVFLEEMEQGTALSEREGASRFRISRHKMRAIIQTAKDEKLIKRHAKTFKITQGGKDFLADRDAGV